MSRSRDDIAADLLEALGGMATTVASVVGRPDAAIAVRAVTQAAADAIRKRGATTSQLVEALRHIGPVRMPWDREGKP